MPLANTEGIKPQTKPPRTTPLSGPPRARCCSGGCPCEEKTENEQYQLFNSRGLPSGFLCLYLHTLRCLGLLMGWIGERSFGSTPDVSTRERADARSGSGLETMRTGELKINQGSSVLEGSLA